eukprot:CAMPEP_0178683510 /NCGR_PEP_ID=MMETSP0699-20121125/2345_1 /TAXON_ID=265572 /ORGANISM="Extubocellulus spinifer, Strain CCMP396" /LENGTH=340 /DNA_ID=CAMNT_0020328115 /DNA_START=66 /DNA_END=1087 /DNA_ORIENTATION=-
MASTGTGTGTGVKRPAVETEDSSRASQAPRLEVSTDVVPDADTVLDANGGIVPPGAGFGIDLIRGIAIFMSPGADLFNLCAAVGPADAARIRTEYLRENDNYIVHSLREIRNLNLENQRVFCENLVFNSPAVAIEIGLLNVLQFLVEEKGIDVNVVTWEGFNSRGINVQLKKVLQNAVTRGGGFDSRLFHLCRLASIRRDMDLFQYLLTLDNGPTIFQLQNSVVMDIHYIPKDCLRLIMQHPDFEIKRTLALFLYHLAGDLPEMEWEADSVGNIVRDLSSYLDAGGDPRAVDYLLGRRSFLGRRSAIEFARDYLARHPESQNGEVVVAKMEAKIELLERE